MKHLSSYLASTFPRRRNGHISGLFQRSRSLNHLSNHKLGTYTFYQRCDSGLRSGLASTSTSPRPRKGHIFGLLQRSLSLNRLSNRNLGDTSTTKEEDTSFLKRRPLHGFHSTISRTFPEPMKPIELPRFESKQHLSSETRIEISNLPDIEEHEVEANCPFLLPGTQSNHEAHHIRDDSSQKDIIISIGEDEAHSSSVSPPSTESEYSSRTDVDQRTNDWKKVSLEWLIAVGNVIAEILLAVFDQLSSPKKPQFALVAMVISFIAVIFCIVEIFRKYRQGNYTWKIKGNIYWHYDENVDDKPFGTLTDFFGLVCALLQFIFTTVCYVFYRFWHDKCPTKLSVFSVIFAVGLLCRKIFSKLTEEMRAL